MARGLRPCKQFKSVDVDERDGCHRVLKEVPKFFERLGSNSNVTMKFVTTGKQRYY